METILKVIEINGEMKTKEIFNLIKTNSQKINFEIIKKIEAFNKIDDLFNYYSNKTCLLEFLNKLQFLL